MVSRSLVQMQDESAIYFLTAVLYSLEEKLVEKTLTEVDTAIPNDKSWSESEVENLQKRPWEVLEGMPLKLSPAEKTLHPRFHSASLYIARRTVYSLNPPDNQ